MPTNKRSHTTLKVAVKAHPNKNTYTSAACLCIITPLKFPICGPDFVMFLTWQALLEADEAVSADFANEDADMVLCLFQSQQMGD